MGRVVENGEPSPQLLLTPVTRESFTTISTTPEVIEVISIEINNIRIKLLWIDTLQENREGYRNNRRAQRKRVV